MTSPATVVFNGRFTGMAMTGVQRYAVGVVGALPPGPFARFLVAAPPNRVVAALNDLDPSRGSTSWSGPLGHAWEQAILPALARRVDADLLVNLCNWGPLAARPHLTVFHDLAHLRVPRFYSRAYRSWAGLAWPRLARTARRLVTVSRRSKEEIVDLLGVSPDKVDVVPGGVGAPFTEVPLGDLDRRRGDYCVFLGAHDPRKNLRFLRRLWPRVWKRQGLRLYVVHGGTSRPHPALPALRGAGITVVPQPDDTGLARLYSGALCLLWPSLYEGFGLPLLEAMATGTPFLSTEVGAARDLAVEPQQVLPLRLEAWEAELERLRSTSLAGLRAACAERARGYAWEKSAAGLVASIERCLG